MANEFVTRTGLIVSGSTFLPAVTTASKGYILSFDDTTKQVYYMSTSSVTVTVPGSDTQVIYNNGGAFGASPNFVFSGSNIGIGTSSPGFKLEVSGSAKVTYLQIQNNGYAGGLPTTPEIYSPASATLAISAGGAERLRIDSSGNLLVGLSTALANGKLQVAGSIGLSGNTQIRQATNSDGNTLQIFATQLVAGSLNSISYGYTGGGLLASVSAGDSTLLLDVGRATSTEGRFKVANTISPDTTISLEKSGSYTLFGDTSNSRVGIGKNAPNATLDVSGSVLISGSLTVSGSSTFTNIGPAVFTGSITQNASTASFGGLVGIGTTTPGKTLDITGEIRTSGRATFNEYVNTGFIYGNTDLVLAYSGGTSGILINSSGNVGIGTTSPAEKLDVSGSIKISYPTGKLYAAATPSFYGEITPFNASGQMIFNVNYPEGNIIFQSGSVEVARFKDAKLGIGTDSPNVTLEANGIIRSDRVGVASQYVQINGGDAAGPFITAAGAAKVLTIQNNSTTSSDIFFDQAVASTYQFKQATVTKMILDASGNVGIGPTNPSKKLHVEVSAADDGFILSKSGSANTIFRATMDGTNDRGEIFLYNSGTAIFAIRPSSNVSYINTGNNFGIGKTSPNATLDVSGSVLISGSLTVSGSSTFTNIGPAVFTGSITQNASTASFGGLVGIGTATPAYKLDVNSDAIRFGDGGSAVFYMNVVNDPSVAGHINVGGSNRISILGSGNVGVGTTTPGFKLDVNGTVNVAAGNYYRVGSTAVAFVSGNEVQYGNQGGSDFVTISTGTTEKFRITTGGNVGIGTTTPSEILDVQKAGTVAVRVYNTSSTADAYFDAKNSTGNAFFGINATGQYLYTSNNIPTLFYNSGSERMRITNAGDVGIGNTSPNDKLDVSGNVSANAFNAVGSLARYNGIGGVAIAGLGGSSYAYISAYSDNGGTGKNLALQKDGGNVGIGTTSPTDKLHVQDGRITATSGSTYGISIEASGSGGRGGIISTKAGSDWNPVMYFTSQSRVGIGTGAPTATLEVGGNIKATSFTGSFSGSVSAPGSTTQVVYNSGGALAADSGLVYSGSRVGIGTATPANNLHIYGTSDQIIKIENSGTYLMYAGLISNEGYIGSTNATPLGFYTNGSNRMYINTSGNVGIGTTSPSAKLHVSSTGETTLTIDSTSSGTARINLTGAGGGAGSITSTVGGLYLNASGNNPLTFNTSGSERMRVAGDGNVGIGTTSPSATLVVSNGGAAGIELQPEQTTDTNRILNYDRATATYMDLRIDANTHRFMLSGVEKMRITNSGNVGINTTSPNATLDVSGSVLISGSLTVSGSSTFTNIGPAVFTGSITQNASTASFGGLVGIGTTTPTEKLDIYGNLNFSIQDGVSISTKESLVFNLNSQNNQSGRVFQFRNYTSSLVVIQQAGNVGIGETAPDFKLVVTDTNNYKGILVNGSNAPVIAFDKGVGQTAEWKVGISGNDGESFSVSSGTSNTDRFFISSSGNVGINTTTPTATLEVNGNVKATSFTGSFSGSVSAPGSTTQIVYNSGGALAADSGLVYSGSNVGIGTATPELISNTTALTINGSTGGGAVSFQVGGVRTGLINGNDNYLTIQSYASRPLSLGYNGNNTIVVNTSNNVGIGTTSPGAKLHVVGTESRFGGVASGFISVYNANSRSGYFQANEGSDFRIASDINDMTFYVSGSEKVRFTSAGNVGIGTSSPSTKLQVDGTLTVTNGGINIPADTPIRKAGDNSIILYSSTLPGINIGSGTVTDMVVLNAGGTERVRINTSGSMGIGTTTPAATLDVNGGSIIRGNLTLAGGSRYITGDGGDLFIDTENVSGRDVLLQTVSGQKVGIGTTAPGAKLDIVSTGAGSEGLRVDGSGGGFAFVVKAGSDYTSHIRAGATVGVNYFTTPPSNGLIVEGNVGIGTTTPSSSLHVAGTITAATTADSGRINLGTQDTNQIGLYRDNTYDLVLLQDASSGNPLYLAGAGDVRVSIDSNNNNTNSKFIVGNNDKKSTNELFSVDESGSGYFSGSLTVQGTITAQKLNVQQITSSVIYSSGSNIFGNSLANTQTFTGSLQVTGSTHYLLGNVGIGTTSSQARLHINPATVDEIAIAINGTQNYSSNSYQRISAGDQTSLNRVAIGFGYDSTPEWTIKYSSYHTHAFFTGNDWGSSTERMRITSAGYVGIGTTNPTQYSSLFPAQLAVNASSTVDGIFSTTDNGSAAELVLFKKSTTNDFGSLLIQHSGSVGRAIEVNYGVNMSTGVGGTTSYFVNTNGSGYYAGNVGIGTTSPSNTLQVVGGVTATSFTGSFSGSITAPGSTTQVAFNSGGTLSADSGFVYSGSNVGIGTTNPVNKLSILGLNSAPATSGTGSNGQLRLGATDSSVVLDMGVQQSSAYSWIQSRERDAYASNYKLSLNPNGGNVGIGTTSPTAKLQVKGDGGSTGITFQTTDSSNNQNFYVLDGGRAGTQYYPFMIAHSSSVTPTGQPYLQVATSALYVSQSGAVGIGTSTPDQKLELYSSSDVALRIHKNSVGEVIMGISGSAGADATQFITNTNGFDFRGDSNTFPGGGSSRLFISSSGNVGIGTTNPVQALHVVGNIYQRTGDFITWSNGDAQIGAVYGYALAFSTYNGSSAMVEHLRITSTGNVGIGTTSPNTKLDVSGSISLAGTDGLRIGSVGDNSAYDNVKLYYSGYNGGAPRVYLTPRTTPGSGVVQTYFHLLNSNGSSTTSNNTMGLLVDGNVGIGTTSTSYNLQVSESIAIENQGTTTIESTTFAGSLTTNTNIVSVPTGSFKAAFFDYYVASGSVNMRAGTVMAVHNNSTSRYTDTSTADIGTTAAVDFSTSIVAGSLVLTANIASGTWEIKTAYRAL